ncbi:MAG: hypothetical protein A2Z74_00280 [Chloroflexi bacterium RBG_13_46_9]|nr:MAG: hypothetical protein A2Z74_00280 [Chloroflexi bacterium RBG_13_46_9]
MDREWTVILYAREDGKESVLKEINSYGKRNYLKILKTVELLKHYGTTLSPDRIKHINGKIWELKIDHYRILYFPYGNRQFILLRIFLKKTSKTPTNEIKLALKRLTEYTIRAGGD